jgi:DNA invertase Pin-like site-specific DNA recombinase
MIHAVMYLRVSTKKREQEASVPAQRELVLRWAKENNYRVIREYVDEGVSGDDTERRKEFQKMVADASAGDFKAVLCADVDRFGRFDPLDAGHWIYPLRKAGVHLATVAQGRLDWDGPVGVLVYCLHQTGAKEYITKLSGRVAVGMRNKAREGRPLGGQAAFGYVWEYEEVMDRNKPVLRPSRLVPGDPGQIEVVRWMYRTYLETDISLQGLLIDLNRRGVPSPEGKRWHRSAVRTILTNPVYKGDRVWNRRHMGKYHGVEGGEVRAMRKRLWEGREVSVQWNPEGEWFVKKGAHEPLVPAEVWEAVQAKIRSRRLRRTPIPGGGDYLLTGLVRCMHCGRLMYNRADMNGQGRRYPGLICASYMQGGECYSYRTKQAPLVNAVLKLIERFFRVPENLEAIRAEIRKQLASRKGSDPTRRKSLERQLAGLKDKIDRGLENLLVAKADLRDALEAKLRELQDRERQLRRELEGLGRPAPTEAELLAGVDRAAALLTNLRESVAGAAPARVREILRRAVSRIDCWFDVVPYGSSTRRKTTPLRRGVIHIRPDLICKDDLSGGPRRMPTGETS